MNLTVLLMKERMTIAFFNQVERVGKAILGSSPRPFQREIHAAQLVGRLQVSVCIRKLELLAKIC